LTGGDRTSFPATIVVVVVVVDIGFAIRVRVRVFSGPDL
jgi:hypothetical protein